MNTRVKIWPTSVPSGKVHSYDVQTKDGLTAAAEALAHFASLKEGPDITVDSTLEVHLDQADVPEQVFTVRVVLDYLRSQSALLDGLENKSDLDVLGRLAGRVETLD